MDLLPKINDPIVLCDFADRTYRSRVEGLPPGAVTVAQPLELPAEHAYRPGVDMLVTWTCARGIAVLPTRLVAAHAERRLRLWSMAITGDGWIEQRRRFVRASTAGPLILRPRGDGPAVELVHGRLLDVSEASLRCLVEVAAADGILDGDLEVIATFRLGDSEFEVPARIGVRRPGAHSGEHAELVVLFDEPVTNADALRKQVFAQQLRSRRR